MFRLANGDFVPVSIHYGYSVLHRGFAVACVLRNAHHPLGIHIGQKGKANLMRQFAPIFSRGSYHVHGSYLGDINVHGLQTSFHASAVRAYYIQVMRPVDLKILLQIVITVPAIQKSIGAALDDDLKGSLW